MSEELPLVLSFLGGSISSCTGEVITFPMDLLKTKMQLGGTQGGVKYSGPVHAITDTYNKKGIRGFYWGIVPAFNRQFVFSGVRIALYDKIKALMGLDTLSGGIFQRFLIGAFSGGLASFICTPLDVCKVRIINDPDKLKYTGFSDCLKKTWTSEGFVKGFYRGSSPNIYRSVVVNACELGTYDTIKGVLINAVGYEETSIMLRFWASLAAGFVAAVCSSPIDVVKTRYMNSTKADPTKIKPGELRFTSPLDCLKKIVAHEGVGSLYNGFWFLWLRIGPWCTIMFLTWDAYKDIVGREYKKYKAKELIKQ